MEKKYFDINGIPLDYKEISGTRNLITETSKSTPYYYTPQCRFSSINEDMRVWLYNNCKPNKHVQYASGLTYDFSFGYNNINIGKDLNNKDLNITIGGTVNSKGYSGTIHQMVQNFYTNEQYSGNIDFNRVNWIQKTEFSEYAVLIHTTGDDKYTIIYMCFATNRSSSASYRQDITIYQFASITGQWRNIEFTNSYSEREFDNIKDTEENGGYGTGAMPQDNIILPSLPAIAMSNTGASLYNLTPVQMQDFTRWLWTSDWQENIKKIRTDPMQNIIGISLLDIQLVNISESTIHVGNLDTNITGSVVTNTFVELDCGTITLDEYYGTFADYEPFCATTLYLPKVGFIQIPADACVNNNIHVVYHIELSSGEGLCYVLLQSARDNVEYIWNTYTCHTTSNITLSAQDHTQQLLALGNAIVNTSVATAGAIINPASSVSAFNTALSSCIDVATTKNPTQTKGNIGNMSAIMCYKKPYLLINRTNLAKPSSFQENNGYLINYTAKIEGHTGFLKTRDYHCEFNAPYNHRAEIERLLDTGVIING